MQPSCYIEEIVDIACDVCGKIVRRKPSDVARAKHSLCSPRCRIARYAATVAEGRQSAAALFWTHVDKRPGGCWLWTGNRRNQYGQFYVGARVLVAAHRYSYELAHGSIPRGVFVCHHCDTPGCVNPDHLFLGSARDNARDMFEKGRARPNKLPPQPPGEGHVMAKLTSVQVAQIRSFYRTGGISQSELGKTFGVSRSAIQLIVTGKRWTHQEP